MANLKEKYADLISQLIPINELSPKLQRQLIASAEIIECKKKRHVFKQGDKDNYSFYLLDGEIDLLANGQLHSTIVAGSVQADYAMAQLQPRQFSAKAKIKSTILQIERNIMDQLLVLVNELSAAQPDVDESPDEDMDWMTKMLQSASFSKIPTANMHQLFAALEPLEKESDEVVVRQGDKGEHYYIVESGSCVVSRKPSPTSPEVKLTELGPGDSFGEEALVSDATRNATVRMLNAGTVMQLSKDDFMRLIKTPILTSVSFEEATAANAKGSVWLDVRSENEHAGEAIKGSVNIPLNALRLQIDELDQEIKYMVYCDNGGRSATATFLLTERGFDACCLQGGLVNNPAALPDDDDDEDDDEFAPEVHTEVVNVDLETTQLRLEKIKQAVEGADEKAKKKQQKIAAELEKKRKILEAEKRAAEEEMRKKAADEEERLRQLKQKTKRIIEKKKQKLDDIYARNQAEIEKLERLKKTSQRQLEEQRAKLAQQAEESKRKMGKADHLRKQLEQSRRQLEQQAKKGRREQEEMERKLKAKAKAIVDREKKKLAGEYERNLAEFKKLQQARTVAAAAKKAAQQEAAKIIQEFKTTHGRDRTAEETKLHNERLKLEQEAKKIQQALIQIQKTKAGAAAQRKAAMQRADQLKNQQKERTAPPGLTLEDLAGELKAMEHKIIQANQHLHNATEKEKSTASTKDKINRDLLKKKKQEEILTQRVKNDLLNFEDAQRREAESTVIQSRAKLVHRIKNQTKVAKVKVQQADSVLLADIKAQLDD